MLLSEATAKFKIHLINAERSPETVSGYMKDLKYLKMYLQNDFNGAIYLEDITEDHIEGFLAYQKKRGMSAATRSRNLYSVRSLYNFAYRKKICSRNVALSVDPIKLKQKERTYLTGSEQEELINSIDHKLIKIVVITLCNTGLRISECLHLKMEDVDLKTKMINVINGKGGKERKVPINDKLHAVLTAYVANITNIKNSIYFFETKKTGRLSAQYVNRILKETTYKLGWSKKVSAHILRHSFASSLLSKGSNLVDIQKLLGHSNLKVTSIYLHVSMNELVSTVNLL